MPRGDIRTRKYVYAWSGLNGYMPRSISPTDQDAAIESRHRYLWFEGKAEGVGMDEGQSLFYKHLLEDLAGKSVLMLAEHPDKDVVDVATELTRVRLWWWDGQRVYREMPTPSMVPILVGFYADAEAGGLLRPTIW